MSRMTFPSGVAGAEFLAATPLVPVTRMERKKEVETGFYTCEYNGATIMVNRDCSMFHVSKFIAEMCPRRKKNKKTGQYTDKCTISHADWKKGETFKGFYELHEERFHKYGGKGSQKYKGFYASFKYLQNIGEFADPFRYQEWKEGNPEWRKIDINDRGYIYLVRSLVHDGKEVSKPGRTDDIRKRFRDYKLYTKDKKKGIFECRKDLIYRAIYVRNMYKYEDILMTRFRGRNFDKVPSTDNGGDEYFACTAKDAMKVFDEVMAEYDDMIIEEYNIKEIVNILKK